jgi:2-C-methyl-D-erythritol 2,4-cyclodiphosphate synthase
MLSEAGWQTENLDCTLVLEAPKIGNYVSDMKRTLAGVIGIEPSDISIKATTNETMGYVGRREGLNAMAVVLISKK